MIQNRARNEDVEENIEDQKQRNVENVEETVGPKKMKPDAKLCRECGIVNRNTTVENYHWSPRLWLFGVDVFIW